MPKQQTHQTIDATLCGEPILLEPGRASVALTTHPSMAADESGLVHGGFIFGLADYAAMLAINHPNVVLGSASSKFLRPTVTGAHLVADATVTRQAAKKTTVHVCVTEDGAPVFEGEFVCFTPDQHVLA